MDKGKGKAKATNVSSTTAVTGVRSATNAIGISTCTATGAATAAAAAAEAGRDGIEDSELSYNETIDAIVQFLEAAFHTVLYIRGVYPPEIFKAHRLYSHPVYRSRHPGLNEYISTVLTSIRSELQASRISQVLLVLKSSSTGIFLERYTFHLAYLLPSLRRVDRDLSIKDNVTFRELSAIFRGFLMKLAVCEGGLELVEDVEDVEFAIMLRAREGCRIGPQGGDLHSPDEGMWVSADPREGFFGGERSEDEERQLGDGEIRARRRRGGDGDGNDQDATILPIKSLDSGVINLMLYVEDNPKSKASLRRSVRRTSNSNSKPHSIPPSSRRRKAEFQHPPPPTQEDQDIDIDFTPVDKEKNLDDPSGERDIEDLLLREDRGTGTGNELDIDVDVEVEEEEESEKRGTKRKGIARRSLSNPNSNSHSHSKTNIKIKTKAKGNRRSNLPHDTRIRTRPTSSLLLVQEEKDQEDLSDSSFSENSQEEEEESEGNGDASGAGGAGGRRGREEESQVERRSTSSPGLDERSDVSIVSVGDFAGYGGAGAGGGMHAAW